MVEVVAASKRYRGASALDGLSLQAAAGEVTALLGPNGAGKTTLVECLVGLRRPDSGSVRVLGVDPATARPNHRSAVGVMLQDSGLPGAARPLAVLRQLASFHREPADVGALAERLGITGFARTTVRRLSGGQRQRLALAAALVGRPRVVLLDEPTAGLDPQSRLVVRDVVEELRDDGVAVLLTTHDLDEAARTAGHVIIVDHGRVVADGSPQSLLAGRAGTARFSAPAGIDVGSLRRALPERVELTSSGAGGYVVRGAVDASVLATLTAWCAGQGVMPDGLQVGSGDLEELFLELTGRTLR